MAAPLNQTDCDCLNKAIAALREVLPIIDACERCGFDLTAAREQAQQILQTAELLLKEFFPHAG